MDYTAPWHRERTEADTVEIMRRFPHVSREDAETAPLSILYLIPEKPLPLTEAEMAFGREVAKRIEDAGRDSAGRK